MLGCILVMYMTEYRPGRLLSPARFLTKICMVSSASAEEAREEVLDMLEMLLERMLMAVL